MTALTQEIPNPAIVLTVLAVAAAAGPVGLVVALWDRGVSPWRTVRARIRRR